MRTVKAILLGLSVLISSMFAQTPPQQPKEEVAPEDVIRITSSLVQTDIVVTDKNDRVVPDLKLEDFEVYDNGKKQDLKFLEYVSVDSGTRTEGARPSVAADSARETNPGPSARDIKRIVAFVIDDLTIPVQDISPVRSMLRDFVDNKMIDGDLVAIVRVVGGKGLLQQFTSDKALLRRAVAAITYTANPFMASETPDPVMTINPLAAPAIDSPTADVPEAPEIYSPNDDVVRLFRGMSTLTTASFVIDSLKEVPGHKNLVIISGGIPIFENGSTGANYSNITYLLNVLTDKAVRAGVVINTLDPRGLRATPGVVSFQATPAKSALGGSDANDATFGRGGQLDQAIFGPLLAGGAEHLGLSTVANSTGGVAVVNTNNFSAGLDKILARSRGYYELAYSPGEKFDRKFHKIDVKVKREGLRVFHHAGYVAAAETSAPAHRTKEQEIARAALSPLTSRDINVSPNVTIKPVMTGPAAVDIHLLIEAGKLHFTDANDSHQTSLDIVGFVFDQLGRQRGGFSETLNLNLNEAQYQKAVKEGLTYSASTQLPAGYYQVRAVVREASSGGLGTFSKYVEVPDLSKGRMATSSLFLYAVNPSQSSSPQPLLSARILTRKQDLRYAMTIYNAKMKDGKPQITSQMIISQGSKVLFTEPEQQIEGSGVAITKIGQLGLAKVALGRYVLTLVVTDTNDRKNKVARSLDFNVVN